MKHWKGLLLTLLLWCLPVCALAELRAEASVTPSALVMPDTVTLTVTGTNEDARDIRLCDMDGNVLCEMGSEGSISYTGTYDVTRQEIDDACVSLLLRYYVEEEARSQKLTAALTPMEANASMRVTRSVATENGQTVLLYRIANTGNVPLRDICVRDPLCGAQAEAESLSAGEKKTLRVVIPAREDMVTQPTVTAVSAFDGKTLRCDVAPLTIDCGGTDVTTHADCVCQEDGTALLRVDITNNGASTVSGIRVTGEKLGSIGSFSGSLAPGERYTVSRVIACKQTQEYVLRVSDGEGAFLTEAAFVAVAREDAPDMDFTLSAQAQRAQKGVITAQLTLVNNADTVLRDVVISESRAGELRTLSALPAGETRLTVTFPSETDTLQFLATVTQWDDTRRTALAEAVAEDGANAAPIERGTLPRQGAVSERCDETAAYPRMLVTVLGVIALLAALFSRQAILRKNLNRKERDTHLKNLRRTRKSERQAGLDPMEATKEHKIIKAGDI